MIKQHFTGFEVLKDYKSTDLLFSTKGRVELDIFVPNLALAFEYQGEQHYQANWYLGDRTAAHKRDKEKRALCKEYGITLIEVPFWWDKKKDSFLASVHAIGLGILYNDKRLAYKYDIKARDPLQFTKE